MGTLEVIEIMNRMIEQTKTTKLKTQLQAISM